MVIFLAIGIKMLLHWRKSREDYQMLMREKVETELKFLKTQLNPHFLFNTLNNLYYLSTVKSDKAPQAILALSDVLDYILKEGKSTFVPLDNELQHLNSYVALELLRYEERVNVKITVTGDTNKHRIGPMILITLMENAFKHGAMPTAGKSWIDMSVHCTDHELCFELRNGSRQKNTGHGIGLENLKSQLKHLYHENFNLNIKETNDEVFGVKLTIVGPVKQ